MNLKSLFIGIIICFLGVSAQGTRAVEIQEVTTDRGISAYLVEDYTLPIVSLSFSIDNGSALDPKGKEGAVRLMTALLDEGAGDFDATEFQAQVEALGINLGFSVGREAFSGGMRVLKEDLAAASELMRLAMLEPRFDGPAIERMRDAIRTGIIRSKTNPGAIAGKALRNTLFPGHPYSRETRGSEQSIDAITRDDLVKLHKSIINRNGLNVGVVGAINAEELRTLLDYLFGDLGNSENPIQIQDVEPVMGKVEHIEFDEPNTRVSIIYPGVLRHDPDFFTAHVMSYILGGGSFSSRLFTEVREKRGLVYGISSGMSVLDHTAYLSIGTSTRTENAQETIKVIETEVNKMASGDITAEELEAAKKYLIGAYAIGNLDTSSKIARALVTIQRENLGINYFTERENQIAAVTLEKINAMAKRLLSGEPSVVTIGRKVTTQ